VGHSIENHVSFQRKMAVAQPESSPVEPWCILGCHASLSIRIQSLKPNISHVQHLHNQPDRILELRNKSSIFLAEFYFNLGDYTRLPCDSCSFNSILLP